MSCGSWAERRRRRSQDLPLTGGGGGGRRANWQRLLVVLGAMESLCGMLLLRGLGRPPHRRKDQTGSLEGTSPAASFPKNFGLGASRPPPAGVVVLSSVGAPGGGVGSTFLFGCGAFAAAARGGRLCAHAHQRLPPGDEVGALAVGLAAAAPLHSPARGSLLRRRWNAGRLGDRGRPEELDHGIRPLARQGRRRALAAGALEGLAGARPRPRLVGAVNRRAHEARPQRHARHPPATFGTPTVVEIEERKSQHENRCCRRS